MSTYKLANRETHLMFYFLRIMFHIVLQINCTMCCFNLLNYTKVYFVPIKVKRIMLNIT